MLLLKDLCLINDIDRLTDSARLSVFHLPAVHRPCSNSDRKKAKASFPADLTFLTHIRVCRIIQELPTLIKP